MKLVSVMSKFGILEFDEVGKSFQTRYRRNLGRISNRDGYKIKVSKIIKLLLIFQDLVLLVLPRYTDRGMGEAAEKGIYSDLCGHLSNLYLL